MAERGKRAIDDPEIWPTAALVEKLQECLDALFRRWSTMQREEAKSLGLDADEVLFVARDAMLTSIESWSPGGGKNPDGYTKYLLRLRYLSKRKAEMAKRTVSLDAPIVGDDCSLGEKTPDERAQAIFDEVLDRVQERIRQARSVESGAVDPALFEGLVQQELFALEETAA